MKTPKVLIIGGRGDSASCLIRRLEMQGCQCHFASTFEVALRLIATERFDLAFSPVLRLPGTVYSLMDALTGSQTSLFYSHSVQDGCWWVPAMRCGEKCLGSAAFRPAEFVGVLDELIEEIKHCGPVSRILPATSTKMSNLSTQRAGTLPRPRPKKRLQSWPNDNVRTKAIG